MLYLLSPAKTLDYDRPAPAHPVRRPAFCDESAALIARLRALDADDVAGLMDLSAALAELNVQRYADWRPRFTARNSRPAVLAFNGDVYEGLQAASLDADGLAWADDHLAILSGLYGVLRPLDAMQPYRLEMGTALRTDRGDNLYAFWGDTLAEHLNRRLRGHRHKVIVNLASQEYFRAADRPALKPRVIECVFEDWKGEGYKVISFFAKRARGLMARHAIDRRIDHPDGLVEFDAEGYRFAPDVSSPDRLVFRRRVAS